MTSPMRGGFGLGDRTFGSIGGGFNAGFGNRGIWGPGRGFGPGWGNRGWGWGGGCWNCGFGFGWGLGWGFGWGGLGFGWGWPYWGSPWWGYPYYAYPYPYLGWDPWAPVGYFGDSTVYPGDSYPYPDTDPFYNGSSGDTGYGPYGQDYAPAQNDNSNYSGPIESTSSAPSDKSNTPNNAAPAQQNYETPVGNTLAPNRT